MSSSENDRLLQRVKADGDEPSAYALLDAFFSGFPVERLREVLNSSNERAVRAGVWLASELGTRATPLVADLAILLGHESKYVRFFAVDGLLTTASHRDGAAIARAISLLNDPDDAVRWKTTQFLSRATIEQLAASIGYLAPELNSRVSWLLARENERDGEPVLEQLSQPEQIDRLFGLVAAQRRSHRDRQLLLAAARSSDSAIRRMADEWLEARR